MDSKSAPISVMPNLFNKLEEPLCIFSESYLKRHNLAQSFSNVACIQVHNCDNEMGNTVDHVQLTVICIQIFGAEK